MGGSGMGLEDRDWYREAYKEKERKYGSDFSRNPGTGRGPFRKSSGLKTAVVYLVIIVVIVALVYILKNPSIIPMLKR